MKRRTVETSRDKKKRVGSIKNQKQERAREVASGMFESWNF